MSDITLTVTLSQGHQMMYQFSILTPLDRLLTHIVNAWQWLFLCETVFVAATLFMVILFRAYQLN